MRKIDLLELFESVDAIELGDGAAMLNSQEIIEIKKGSVEMILVIKGSATVIYKEGGKKEVASVSKGEACFFSVYDESVMLQEGSLVLVIDKKIKKCAAGNTKKSGFFGRKVSADQRPEGEVAEQVSKRNILSEMIPKVRQAWFQVVGPISASVVNDEARFKELASTVYTVLPMPIRMVVKEDFFVNWCYEKRNVISVENPESLASADQAALVEAGVKN